MCVKLIKNGQKVAYDQNKPLEKQLVGCSQVLFDCVKDDRELFQFLQEMMKLVGDIKYEIVSKALTSNFQKAEDKLEELSLMCASRE